MPLKLGTPLRLVATLSVIAQMYASAARLCVVVHDYADLPLPGAWVNVINVTASKPNANSFVPSYSMSTDSVGKACQILPEGTYSVEAGLTGFLNVRYYPVRVALPNVVDLSYRLPNGPVGEGGVEQEAILSGTLQVDGKPLGDTKICIWKNSESPSLVACGLTNESGEYVLYVPPGMYRAEIRTSDGEVHRSTVNVRAPGHYRNRLIVNKSVPPNQRP
jgi:hypothetical protein